ncbi:MAG: CRTAC1 family protein [Verrucomicrobiaceae bacterium]
MSLILLHRCNLALILALAGALKAQDTNEIDLERQALDASAFAEETEAGRHGNTVTALWDTLRADQDFPAVAEPYLPETVILPARFNFQNIGESPFGTISRHAPADTEKQTLDRNRFSAFLKSLKDSGWLLVESEWHHLSFKKAAAPEKSATSTFNITLHLENNSANHKRLILRGHIHTTWIPANRQKKGESPKWLEVDASGLSALTREGTLPFKIIKELHAREINSLNSERLHPVLVDDLNRDGLPDILLGGTNAILLNNGDLGFTPAKITAYAEPISSGAILGDFNGDGRVDILAADTLDLTLRLFAGKPLDEIGKKGPLFEGGRPCFDAKLPATQAITAADIDHDGDLDIFLGQYRSPYQGGEVPEPFYDANDGYPSYLLLNDGKGQFTDITDSSGLGKKRHRRNYAASFADINADSHLDLILTSDFAGVDVFEGNGKGQFTDRTATWLTQPRLFGMTHVLADFDRDSRTDLFAVGMASTTARRLEGMNLGLAGEKKITAQRASMGYGNRIYFSKDDPSFALTEPAWAHDLAESGWSWGAAAPDLDNNGLRDLYIANGHVSGKSADDYCSTFWRHDIYTPLRKKDGQKWNTHFAKQLEPLVNYETSWNGYEHNVAFIQQAPNQFTNLSFLLGLSQEGDSRAVISTDLDRDGDMDLIITILEPGEETIHRLVIYENTIPAGKADTGWIGIDLGGPDASPAPWNARVTITRADGSKETSVVTTGGSFASQKPSAIHFGLGKATSVNALDITWADGTSRTLKNPAINKWHSVSPAE